MASRGNLGDGNGDTAFAGDTSPSMKRRGSIKSRTSVNVDHHRPNSPTNSHRAETTSLHSRNDTLSLSGHRRNRSDVSQVSMVSMVSVVSHATESDSHPTVDEVPEIVVLVEQPPKNLLCLLCSKLFREPVIAKCGHTFCKPCLVTMTRGEVCPTHRTALSKTGTIPNIAVAEQIGELVIRCKYGCKLNEDGNKMESDPKGCPVTTTLAHRKDHEDSCTYAPTTCPNSSSCGRILVRDLEDHLAKCDLALCTNSSHGCTFSGTQAKVKEHVDNCSFNRRSIIDDSRFLQMTKAIKERDDEIAFLRGALAKVMDRMDKMELVYDSRIGAMIEDFNEISENLNQTRQSLSEVVNELSALQGRVVDEPDQPHTMRCVGTFVGHQGPVWALATTNELLFSGSSDETIKVWDASNNFSCLRTLNDHRGIIHVLVVNESRLFSGSADCTINVWDIASLELITTLEGHEHPVCTLGIANNLLFSGSLKVIKVWDATTYEMLTELQGINHWVRALVVTERFLYAGSYQSITVWPSDRRSLVGPSQFPQKVVIPAVGGSIYSLGMSDKYIIAGTYENLIQIWDLATFSNVATLQGHTGTVYALTVMNLHGKSKLFSASYDTTIKVWSLDTFQALQTLNRHQNSVNALAVQRGKLLSGAADNTIKVWQ